MLGIEGRIEMTNLQLILVLIINPHNITNTLKSLNPYQYIELLYLQLNVKIQ